MRRLNCFALVVAFVFHFLASAVAQKEAGRALLISAKALLGGRLELEFNASVKVEVVAQDVDSSFESESPTEEPCDARFSVLEFGLPRFIQLMQTAHWNNVHQQPCCYLL